MVGRNKLLWPDSHITLIFIPNSSTSRAWASQFIKWRMWQCLIRCCWHLNSLAIVITHSVIDSATLKLKPSSWLCNREDPPLNLVSMKCYNRRTDWLLKCDLFCWHFNSLGILITHCVINSATWKGAPVSWLCNMDLSTLNLSRMTWLSRSKDWFVTCDLLWLWNDYMCVSLVQMLKCLMMDSVRYQESLLEHRFVVCMFVVIADDICQRDMPPH